MSIYYNASNTSAVLRDSFNPEKYSLKVQWFDGELILSAVQDEPDSTTRVEIMFDENDFGSLLGVLMRMKGEK